MSTKIPSISPGETQGKVSITLVFVLLFGSVLVLLLSLHFWKIVAYREFGWFNNLLHKFEWRGDKGDRNVTFDTLRDAGFAIEMLGILNEQMFFEEARFLQDKVIGPFINRDINAITGNGGVPMVLLHGDLANAKLLATATWNEMPLQGENREVTIFRKTKFHLSKCAEAVTNYFDWIFGAGMKNKPALIYLDEVDTLIEMGSWWKFSPEISPPWGNVRLGWGNVRFDWGNLRLGWGNVRQGWGNVRQGWGTVRLGWGDVRLHWGTVKIAWDQITDSARIFLHHMPYNVVDTLGEHLSKSMEKVRYEGVLVIATVPQISAKDKNFTIFSNVLHIPKLLSLPERRAVLERRVSTWVVPPGDEILDVMAEKTGVFIRGKFDIEEKIGAVCQLAYKNGVTKWKKKYGIVGGGSKIRVDEVNPSLKNWEDALAEILKKLETKSHH
ncbi:hypothetical protein Fcan01_15977 [Folsomia candida]|uniref:Uncharacterized protein n=1 Tax=Folsomia candida TaxID=158441 RepID=A0A226DWW8_FOLCA|nr:hypothetical protein Fcan01_15977 [Folsomia candida]